MWEDRVHRNKKKKKHEPEEATTSRRRKLWGWWGEKEHGKVKAGLRDHAGGVVKVQIYD